MVRSKYFDNYIFLAFSLLVIVGFVFIYSATFTYTPADPFYYVKRHFIALFVAIFAGLFGYLMPMDFWKKWAYAFFGFGIVLLILVYFLPGDSTGTHRWINLGFFKFQPSEYMKFATVLFIAKYLSRKEDILKTLEPFIVIFGVVFLTAVLIAFEPHKGAALFLLILTTLILFSSRANVKPLLIFIPFIIAFGTLIILTSNYAKSRLIGMLNPDPSTKEGYQAFQSLVAFVKGGPFGEGIGSGTQKLKYLPEIHTDYIFALIGEEAGIFGTFFVLALYIIILIRGIQISLSKDDIFVQTLGLGITYIITLNALFHIFVTLNLFPSTGFTLPFISYGGSSLIMNFLYIGILLRISKEPNKINFIQRT
ncbi:cell cycle protein [Sulfurihydrogenibium sp. YO3AOP1]|nr:FtsW/RodA/SpoVE family cell cycle protein [Sulfurihydrogenibium sp. YO3AOP1]ACD66060.1 cell cycle protein [Sulfurihydrogenibium sp. YO3AOP1]